MSPNMPYITTNDSVITQCSFAININWLKNMSISCMINLLCCVNTIQRFKFMCLPFTANKLTGIKKCQ